MLKHLCRICKSLIDSGKDCQNQEQHDKILKNRKEMKDEYDFSPEKVVHKGPVVKDCLITESFKKAVRDYKKKKKDEKDESKKSQ